MSSSVPLANHSQGDPGRTTSFELRCRPDVGQMVRYRLYETGTCECSHIVGKQEIRLHGKSKLENEILPVLFELYLGTGREGTP